MPQSKLNWSAAVNRLRYDDGPVKRLGRPNYGHGSSRCQAESARRGGGNVPGTHQVWRGRVVPAGWSLGPILDATAGTHILHSIESTMRTVDDSAVPAKAAARTVQS